MEKKLKVLGIWLKGCTTEDFNYDMYSGGSLERDIANAKVDVCNQIGDNIQEILNMSDEQIETELKKEE